VPHFSHSAWEVGRLLACPPRAERVERFWRRVSEKSSLGKRASLNIGWSRVFNRTQRASAPLSADSRHSHSHKLHQTVRSQAPSTRSWSTSLAHGKWKTRIKPTSICRPVRASPPQQLHWVRGDTVSRAALKGKYRGPRHRCLRQRCEGLNRILREQCRTRGYRYRKGERKYLDVDD
jgi:hypothetical protein